MIGFDSVEWTDEGNVSLSVDCQSLSYVLYLIGLSPNNEIGVDGFYEIGNREYIYDTLIQGLNSYSFLLDTQM